jgi:hypothetical protein
VFNILTSANTTRVFRSNGDGTFGEYTFAQHPATGWPGYRGFLADVTGDGRADLLWNDVPVWSNRTYVARFARAGIELLPAHDHPDSTDWAGYVTHVADINGDGRADLFWIDTAPDPMPIRRALGGADARFRHLAAQYVPRPAGAGALSTHTADFNGDARADLLLLAPDGRFWIALGRSDGSFHYDSTTRVHPSLRADTDGRGVIAVPILGDFSGNGRSDLLWIETGAETRISMALSQRNAAGRRLRRGPPPPPRGPAAPRPPPRRPPSR